MTAVRPESVSAVELPSLSFSESWKSDKAINPPMESRHSNFDFPMRLKIATSLKSTPMLLIRGSGTVQDTPVER
jgi:hypothetical protein